MIYVLFNEIYLNDKIYFVFIGIREIDKKFNKKIRYTLNSFLLTIIEKPKKSYYLDLVLVPISDLNIYLDKSKTFMDIIYFKCIKEYLEINYPEIMILSKVMNI